MGEEGGGEGEKEDERNIILRKRVVELRDKESTRSGCRLSEKTLNGRNVRSDFFWGEFDRHDELERGREGG